MSREDLVGVMGTVLSSFFAALGFLWNIGLLQLLFSFMAGAFATYAVQRRLQVESDKRRIRRENAITMRDKIYGPIFRDMNGVLENVGSTPQPSWEIKEDLERAMSHYLFHRMGRDLKNRLDALLDRLEKYDTIRRATETMILGVIKDAVAKNHKVDIGIQVGVVQLRLELVNMTVDSIYLEQALLQEKTPTEFVEKAKKRWGENITVETRVAGTKTNLSDFKVLYRVVLDKVSREQLYQEEKKQRKALVSELEAFLEKIKVHVDID